MLVKILIIAVIIVAVLYLVLPKRRRLPAAPSVTPARGSRLALNLFSSAAMLLLILALFCLLLWLGGATEVVSGGGNVLAGTGLLRIGGVLFGLSIACALAAWIKRPR